MKAAAAKFSLVCCVVFFFWGGKTLPPSIVLADVQIINIKVTQRACYRCM